MKYYTDGFSNNKSSGFTICDSDGQVLFRKEYPRRITNNEAELMGVYEAIQHIQDATLITDSKVVTFWVRAGRCKARPDLTPIAEETRRLLKERAVQLQWRPREENLAGRYNESA